ncbi:YkvA family protein [Faecalibacter bovis]|uniref:DUF1232 domain-containing protein n=1 Tax=Faecalibacter bovis TaxID=2898187 RepID=A0ABX7XCB9_9FLAO|nr:YkvA family protein [Faecalibacter bovis]MBS7334391.1 DUF1232 domain-containing protein [Weeksellaceae bacterium]QTV05475.1 DUF1232 domain-containing protein [Faecalibacter bovis]
MNKSKFFKVAGAAAMKAQQDKSFFDKVKAFFRMVSAFRKKQYKPELSNLIFGFLSVLYIVSPIDILPEALLGPFGLIDDFGILMFGMKYFDKEVINFLQWESNHKKYEHVEDAKIIR